MSRPIHLITGANTGLGLEVVKALLKSAAPCEIILACRSLEKANDAIASLDKAHTEGSGSKVWPVQLDVTSDESINKAYGVVSGKVDHLDTLINNAGATLDQLVGESMTLRQMFNASWDVNVTGSHIVTNTFLPLLLKSKDPRLLFITSGTSSLASQLKRTIPLDQSPAAGWPKPGPPGWGSGIGIPAYRSTKTGLNMLMREWARILHNDGVKVFAISPGWLATGLADIGAEKLKSLGALDPSVGGEFVAQVATGQVDDQVGTVAHRMGSQPW